MIILIITIMLPNLFYSPCSRDSGVFLYIGQRILEGEIPYRDVWDHKQPIIYYINALGLLIGKGSFWGVWIIELLFICSASCISFLLLKRYFGYFPAILGNLFWVLTLNKTMQFGNLTEDYALFFQYISLYLFIDAEEKENYIWRYFIIGFMAAFCFFLRQNLIGIWISIVIYIFIKRFMKHQWSQLIIELMLIGFGSFFVIISIGGYFKINNSFCYFWDTTFNYNFVYSSTSFINRLRFINFGFFYIGWFILSISTWCTIFFLLIFKKIKILALTAVSIIGFPLEFFLCSLSGRNYPHYLTTLLPIMSILFSYMVYIIIKIYNTNNNKMPHAFLKFWFLFLFFMYCIIPTKYMVNNYLMIFNKISKGYSAKYSFYIREKAARYIANITNSDDYILIWGAEGGINYLSKRCSPSRFFYQIPLFTKGYTDLNKTKEFLFEIISKTPKIIVDTKDSFLPPLKIKKKQKLEKEIVADYNIKKFLNFVNSNYRFINRIDNWEFYMYDPKNKKEK